MNLVQVSTAEITSSTASVTLTGINSDDVYILAINNFRPASGGQDGRFRTTTSGTADSDSQYDWAFVGMRIQSSFSELVDTNEAAWKYPCGWSCPDDDYGGANGILYLYNFNNSSRYSMVSSESINAYSTNDLLAPRGAWTHTVDETNDGINIFWSTGNIGTGTFTLYKVV